MKGNKFWVTTSAANKPYDANKLGKPCFHNCSKKFPIPRLKILSSPLPIEMGFIAIHGFPPQNIILSDLVLLAHILQLLA